MLSLLWKKTEQAFLVKKFFEIDYLALQSSGAFRQFHSALRKQNFCLLG
jgi:hypothetical protein